MALGFVMPHLQQYGSLVGDVFPPLELLPVPGDKASPVRGVVGAGSGEDGGEGCAGTRSQPVSQGCVGTLSVNH